MEDTKLSRLYHSATMVCAELKEKWRMPQLETSAPLHSPRYRKLLLCYGMGMGGFRARYSIVHRDGILTPRGRADRAALLVALQSLHPCLGLFVCVTRGSVGTDAVHGRDSSHLSGWTLVDRFGY
ncbi:hypothetical protein BDQ94DRAFT_145735 [Aspergillus welwitschiae]|uniref:Uncharacterized protein n=1 Tax=Aspergillus welwitschiae TaxID=1341132 RepID=A0A3F3PZ80_9EURO|nr:hypothetical protein BDQ94DRAFT_145735 [Aspergillus welwitschiae]RDH32260.1 hypothetical protein BDQ94DRAFT_145735 [Aspergillus welwitschiae]